MSSQRSKPLTIMIISGATGRTVRQVVDSALAQFDDPNARIVVKSNVRSTKAAAKIVHDLAGEHAVICHSLVEPDVCDAVVEAARLEMIPVVDVLGRMIAMLSDYLGVAPHREPGLSYQLQRDNFDRIDAVSFTLEHDDGAGLHSLDEADVVLVGVSRVSKSVTCFYLGYRGIRAANVPILPGRPLPRQLTALPKDKVIGLMVNPNRLISVREARRQAFGAVDDDDAYTGRREIVHELVSAESLMKKQGWRRIDVSYMAVEEVARRILNIIKR